MTLDQFTKRQTERIMAADTDGDGKISRAEMAAAGKGGHDHDRMFDRMDANHDGMLDSGEIQAALAQRFRKMDTNGDGIVSPLERRAAHGMHRGKPAPGEEPSQ